MPICENDRCPGPRRQDYVAEQRGRYCLWCGRRLPPPPRQERPVPLRAVRLEDELRALDLLVMSAAKSRIHRQGGLSIGIRTQLGQTMQRVRSALAEDRHSPLAGRAGDLIEAAQSLIDGTASSPTMNILATGFVSRDFEDKGAIAKGVHDRFLKPTPPPSPQQVGPGRSINDKQVTDYKGIRDRVMMTELIHGQRYYFFYHAQDPRMRIAQDLYKKVYERYHRVSVPQDFHFFRFPKPQDRTFDQWRNVTNFLVDKIHETGMIDDNDGGTKLHIMSVNLSLFGSLGHAGEETFHYFQIGKGQTALDPTAFIKDFFDAFGFDSSVVPQLMNAASLIDTSEGSMFQIMIPRGFVDHVAYMAHPHGIPFDDELLDDMHYIGDIKYKWTDLVEGEGDDQHTSKQLSREKMNDELSRKLKLFPQRPPVPQGPPQPLRSAFKGSRPRPVLPQSDEERLRAEAERRRLDDDNMSRRYRGELDALTLRTVERAVAGQYQPSAYLAEYSRDPRRFTDPGIHKHHQHQLRAPDHFGHGKKSPHEIIRIQNRGLYMQARLLLSLDYMLNPLSGIKIVRHTTIDPAAERRYHEVLGTMADVLIRPKPLLMLTYH